MARSLDQYPFTSSGTRNSLSHASHNISFSPNSKLINLSSSSHTLAHALSLLYSACQPNMTVYKHVQAQQKRASKRGRREALSDEDDDLSDSDRSSVAEQSGSESDEDSDEDSEEDLLPRDEDEEELDPDAPRPPPKGFPTATEALENQIVSSKFLIAEQEDGSEEEKGSDEEAKEDEEEELPLVCVVCPNKVLKQGRMVEVHLASKVRPVVLSHWNQALAEPGFDSRRTTSAVSPASKRTSPRPTVPPNTQTPTHGGCRARSTRWCLRG